MRGGTAKLLTLFRPATGEVRAEPVEHATNAVLHPWLKRELKAILAQCPPAPQRGRGRAALGGLGLSRPSADSPTAPAPAAGAADLGQPGRPPKYGLVEWCARQGILPLYTPIAGSWLNMAESVQRIIVRPRPGRPAPADARQEVMAWLAATVRGWNAAPTPFVWGGKRARRRQRARQRRHARHALGGSGAMTRTVITRRWQERLWA